MRLGAPDGDARINGGWRESGPLVRPPKRQGFGSTVLSTLAEINIDAKVELGFESTGVYWRLACEAEEVLDRGAANAKNAN